MTVKIDESVLERIIAEAIGLAAWGASQRCAELLWARESPTLAGLERAMDRVRNEGDVS